MKKFVILLFALFVMSACSMKEESDDNNLKIYTSVYPLEYLVSEIGGDTVDTESIIPPGADGHSYEPTSKDMIKYADGDALVYVGEGMEAFSSDIASSLENENVELIKIGKYNNLFKGKHEEYEGFDDESDKDVIEGLSDHYHTGESLNLEISDSDITNVKWAINSDNEDQFEDAGEGFTFTQEVGENSFSVRAEAYKGDELVYTDYADIVVDNHDDFDPHIWIDPMKMIEVGEILKDDLIALNPEEENLYDENFENLSEKLKELDKEFTETLKNKKNAQIIVPHAAFGYWERYGVEQLPISGYSMSDEPSQKQLKELSETAKETNIEYVLFEQNSPGKISKIVQEEIGAKSGIIHNMEVLTKEDIENNEDYFSLMRKNLKTLNKITS